MGYVNWKKLKARVSITDILEHYGRMSTLHETPQGYEGACPFCESNAFKVTTEKNAWYCFGECKAEGKTNGGNILDFVARKEQVSIKQSAILINDWFPENDEKREETTEKAPTKPPEKAPEKPRTAEPRHQEPAEDGQEQGNAIASPEDESEHPEDSVEPVSQLTENKPLPFILKGVDYHHTTVEEAGIKPSVVEAYSVGYFIGKGSMHNRIVFPFNNDEGRTIAYAGYSPEDGSWKYPPPEKFNPSLSLYGLYQARYSVDRESSLVTLCRDPLTALRYKSKHPETVPLAVTTPELSADQLSLLDSVLEQGGNILLIAPFEDRHVPDILSELLTRYYVKLIRY